VSLGGDERALERVVQVVLGAADVGGNDLLNNNNNSNNAGAGAGSPVNAANTTGGGATRAVGGNLVGTGTFPGQLSASGATGMTDAFDSSVNYLLAKVILDSGVRCEGKNPVEVAKITLNGHDRFSERKGTYFNLVQPYQHHTNIPAVGINVYSFALNPEDHQPSGTCNMSRIDNAQLMLTLTPNTVGYDKTAKVRVYATNYNVLRIMSGMGGLAYSN
jgi:hypothetical protein